MTGPRPLQQLLSAVQMGEQLRLANEEADRARRVSTSSIIDTFMRVAPLQNPEERQATAKLFGQQAGVDPSVLLQAMAQRPVAAATVGDRMAGLQASAMESVYPRIREGVEQIPDANIRDIALNAVAQQFSGLPAGTARQQSTMADEKKIPTDVIKNGIYRQLGEMMTVQEVAQFDQNKERIVQTWSQLADNKTAEAMRLALMKGELQFRMTMAQRQAAGEEGPEPIDPAKAMMDLFDMTEKVTEKPLTKEARAQLAWPLRAQFERTLESLGGRATLQQQSPELLKKLDEIYSPENLLKTSGNFWTTFRK